ncbi:MAG: UDP-galactopyranose mutase [Candidatus Magasanikbacteria bacterium RIFCSPLOWO2_02_FULL_44_11]|uniref:UDP-galactopyranose mutase n=2 Tax=Candidatus Magasanikiibacteriota TaxID=1752731 RepID=A0A1F6N9J8_9BACT|nr:MAG: UDP-galactopyranose mutase [Candidatus Magasanikbacteria bacterium RIFCSPHIGHO2_02_FULL_45_10]OGH80596.1 MAG: UDP-galactopyranose mutase [Candidatus Magasanikbacteria bacterium RIFCSPLOWO2_02_FULL_44_11]
MSEKPFNYSAYDYVIIGAGFFGSVIAERIANELNKRVLIIEKRDHIGGNCYSVDDVETKIHYHKYGTHIFHTSSPKVWDYISRFTEFNSYFHQVLTTYKNKVYQMPINLETINTFYNINLKPFEVEEFLKKEAGKENISEPKNFEEKAISVIGRKLYEAFIKGYTVKQWQKDPKELSESIFNRLPFRTNYNESYYFDRWQGIPVDGYTAIFEKLLAHSNITLQLNTDFFAIRHTIPETTNVIYSGPLDKFFDYKYGKLEWRSLRFENEIKPVADYQGTSVMNYAEQDVPYTRIHEPRHLHPEKKYTNDKTLIVREYSVLEAEDDPYYPVGGPENRVLVKKYLLEAKQVSNYIIGGRLGDYKYYDMDRVIERALDVYEKQIMKNR